MESETQKQKKSHRRYIIPILEEWWINGFLDSSQSLPYAAAGIPFQPDSLEMLKSHSKWKLNSFNHGPSVKRLSAEISSQTHSKSPWTLLFPFAFDWETSVDVFFCDSKHIFHLSKSEIFQNLFISQVLSCYLNVEHSLSSAATISTEHLSPYSNLYWVLAWGHNPFPGSLTGKAT